MCFQHYAKTTDIMLWGIANDGGLAFNQIIYDFKDLLKDIF